MLSPSPGCGSGISEALLGGCEGSPFPADLLTPQGDAAEMGICPRCCRDVSGELGSGSLQMKGNPWQGEKPHLQVACLNTSFTSQFIFSVLA